MMGTSLMTMPWAFGQAGFLGGLLIMFLMAFLALYTAIRLLSLQRVMGMYIRTFFIYMIPFCVVNLYLLL